MRISLKEAIPLEKPFTILFEPAAICNLRCEFCYYSHPDFRPGGLMKMDDFMKIINDLADWGEPKIKVIRFIGFGEPLLNPNIAKMVKVIKQLDLAERVEITTNGTKLEVGLNQNLLYSGLDYLRVSVYNQDEVYDKLLTYCSQRNSQLVVRPFIYVKTFESNIGAENDAFINRFSHVSDEVGLEVSHDWLAGTGEGPRICPQPFKMMSIRYNGNVIMCDPDWQENTLVGNALTENIKDIWNGEKVKAFWKMQLEGRRYENESCRNCDFIMNPNYVLDRLD